jgi:ubiquinone/menaquinone biosynthesis C-methylase UbiE
MVMDDADGVRAFHDAAPLVQLPIYEVNASMMSRLVPEGGRVLDLGSGSAQLAAHLVTGRPDVTVACVDLSDEMLALGRRTAADRGLRQLSYVRADITRLSDDIVGHPDLVCCNWTLHQLPDRDWAVAALRQVARIREEHGCAVWIFDFARRRRSQTMPVLFDLFADGNHDRLRADAIASEAAAWTTHEMHEMLTEAGLTGIEKSSLRPLGIYQSWWTPGQRSCATPSWKRPTMPPHLAEVADGITASMRNVPLPSVGPRPRSAEERAAGQAAVPGPGRTSTEPGPASPSKSAAEASAGRTETPASARAARNEEQADQDDDYRKPLEEEQKLLNGMARSAEQHTEITRARLLLCLESAQHWATALPQYADKQKRRATALAAISSGLAAFAGVAVWPSLRQRLSPLAGAALLSAIALASAIITIVLKLKRYQEMAERAQVLAAIYGEAFGLLLDLCVHGGDIDQQQAHTAISLFQEAKSRKDKLERLPGPKKRNLPSVSEFHACLERGRKLVEAAQTP